MVPEHQKMMIVPEHRGICLAPKRELVVPGWHESEQEEGRKIDTSW
jgi:hypothetical protein